MKSLKVSAPSKLTSASTDVAGHVNLGVNMKSSKSHGDADGFQTNYTPQSTYFEFKVQASTSVSLLSSLSLDDDIPIIYKSKSQTLTSALLLSSPPSAGDNVQLNHNIF
jgi:hypothetical protein